MYVDRYSCIRNEKQCNSNRVIFYFNKRLVLFPSKVTAA